jgi:hypothetical protein
VVTVTVSGDGRKTVAVSPWLVTMVTVVSVIGTALVVVPPFEVRMDETTGDEATGTVYETPVESTAVTELTGVTDGELT